MSDQDDVWREEKNMIYANFNAYKSIMAPNCVYKMTSLPNGKV
jgi:hypothetical protein